MKMNVLILSMDSALFNEESNPSGDARNRHIKYLEMLKVRCGVDSEIRIITYTKKSNRINYDDKIPGLIIYGTNSFSRAFYFFSALYVAIRFVFRGWRADLITSQTPMEDGILGLFLSKIYYAKFMPQLHFDIFSDDWKAERILNHFYYFLSFLCFKYSYKIRVVSSPLKSKLVNKFGINPLKINILPVSVSFVPSCLSKEDAKKKVSYKLCNKKVVLFVGRFEEQKNLLLWLRVAREIEHTHSDVFFLLAGHGSQENMLKAEAVRLGIADKVIFIGPVSYDKIGDVYASADLFLLTSNYEGFGRVVLEAGMAEVPCVSTISGGPEDIIIHGVTGYLVQNRNIEEIKDFCTVLIENNNLCQFMGSAARVECNKKFSRDSLVDNLIKIWTN